MPLMFKGVMVKPDENLCFDILGVLILLCLLHTSFRVDSDAMATQVFRLGVIIGDLSSNQHTKVALSESLPRPQSRPSA